MRNSQQETEQRIGETTLRIVSLEDSLGKTTFLEERLSNSEIKTVSDIANEVDGLENGSCRNNLIIHGVQECKGESEDALTKHLKDEIFTKLLELQVQGVERPHRLGGGRTPGKTPQPYL